jgi:hypothetical protein
MVRMSLAGWVLLVGFIARPPAAFALPSNKSITLPGDREWVDTGVDVKAGDVYQFEASGEITYAAARSAIPPDGSPKGWRDLMKAFPAEDANRGAVIGRIGSSEAALPFLIGASKQVTMPIDGRLFLGINHPSSSTAEGSFTVKLNLVKSSPKDAATFSGKLPALEASYFDRIPRRVSDSQGTPGDRVNFVLVGSEERMKVALRTAGWVIVDTNVQETILKGAIATFSKQAYLTLPMSMLQLFGRNQDYGFAHAEPIAVVTQRHHFRLWKSPDNADGSTVWIGAGTHDIGFDRDVRNNGLTHKIDPDTDKERDYIVETLKQTGAVVRTSYVTPKDTITKAKTAHGEEFFTDGRIVIVWLRPTSVADSTTAASSN